MDGMHPHDTAPLPRHSKSAEKRAAIAVARAEIAAGRRIPLEEVEAWIESWDTPDERPIPEAPTADKPRR